MPQIRPPANSSKLPTVTLHPGELFVAQEPTIITTILGSCVSVCLYCPKNKIGAMCHGVMPSHNSSYQKDSFRFVESSVNYIIDVLTGGGERCPSVSVVAKIFGGANILPVNSQNQAQSSTIGDQNIEAARQTLATSHIPLSFEKVGGSMGCKIFFYSHTGDVFYKKLSR